MMATKNRNFATRVLEVVAKIPKGKTLSYKEVATRAGSPRAARAVGTVLKTYDAKKISVPCHRVIHSDGTLGNYRWGAKKKKDLLIKEKAIL